MARPLRPSPPLILMAWPMPLVGNFFAASLSSLIELEISIDQKMEILVI